MKNAILNWSWDKPTENGFYLMCRGDVEVAENVWAVEVRDGWLKDTSTPKVKVEDMSDSFKYAQLVFGSEARELEANN